MEKNMSAFKMRSRARIRVRMKGEQPG